MTRPLPSTIEAFQDEGKLADKARQEYPEPEHKGIGVWARAGFSSNLRT